ncbi:hypothetical protein HK405_012566, partial [Cladochytrium tenue]
MPRVDPTTARLGPRDVLGAAARALLPASLPATAAAAAASAPPAPLVLLRAPADLLVAVLHAYLTLLGFRLRGLGEDDSVAIAAVAPPAASSSASSAAQDAGTTPLAQQADVLPSGWNASGDAFSLRYTHEQSTFTFLFKAVKVAKKLLLHCLAIQEGKVYSLEIDMDGFVAPSATFPITNDKISVDDASGQVEGLEDVFASTEKLDEFLYLARSQLIDRVMPSINKPGYEPAPVISGSSSAPRAERAPPPSREPYADDPLRDNRRGPPGFGGGGFPAPYYPGSSPFGVGDVDLDPFAAAPGLVPPRGGFGRGGMHPGGGMFVGPDHPIFGGGGVGPFGGGSGGAPPFLPPGSVPPGARFDPIGPLGGGGVPFPGGPGRGGRPGRGGPGFPGGGGYRAGPDNDELQPPGWEDMFS